jgi:hypothetical protein
MVPVSGVVDSGYLSSVQIYFHIAKYIMADCNDSGFQIALSNCRRIINRLFGILILQFTMGLKIG